ncbi:putative membrane protein [Rhizobium mesoamericanum]|nr:putative membrane protein [Rhizobium mesoamericanum]
MMLEQLLLLAHVIGATVLFGTGAGIAFFMVLAHRTRDPKLIAHVARTVVVADTLFTATAAILQPMTGYLLAKLIGWDLAEGWIALSLALYVFTGLFWLPVVAIQIRMRNLARAAAAARTELPAAYFRLYHVWFGFGFPAFFAVAGILWLMVNKPTIALL